MSDSSAEINLRCASCGHTKFYDLAGMLRALQAAGKLKRAKDPARELVIELFESSLGELRCSQCGQYEYEVADTGDWDDDPFTAKRCAACGQAIDPDRLEIFPDTTHCTPCQQKQEANPGGDEEPDYCPRCGGLMRLRGSSRGVSRYILACSDCGYKP